MHHIFYLFLAFCLLITPSYAANGPMEHVKTNVNHVISILTTSKDKQTDKKHLQELLVQAGENLFDFNDVTRLAVGRYWKSFTKEQRKEFRDLFSQLLQSIYMDKIQSYNGEPVIFDKETRLSPKKARVDTFIQLNDKKVPLNYMLRLRNNEWRVYDVIVEGVSLVKNYRSQFSSILSKNPPSVLLEQVKKKIAQQTAKK